jgi:hypothetical protein
MNDSIPADQSAGMPGDLLPWQQHAIHAAASGQLPAVIRLDKCIPASIDGREIAQFLRRPDIAARLEDIKRRQGEVA